MFEIPFGLLGDHVLSGLYIEVLSTAKYVFNPNKRYFHFKCIHSVFGSPDFTSLTLYLWYFPAFDVILYCIKYLTLPSIHICYWYLYMYTKYIAYHPTITTCWKRKQRTQTLRKLIN